MSEFKGKVALVTGGTSGIGRAAAVAFARAGANVVVAGRRQTEGEQTVSEVKKVNSGSEAVFIQTDVSKAAQVKALVDATLARFGRLDFAFNNAGVEGAAAPVADQTEANYDFVFDANVRGIFLSMKYQIPAMLKNGGGAIVNNSSVAGIVGFPGMSIYSASKHAVLGFTKTAALEYSKDGVRVNAISPAAIETDMLTRVVGGDAELKSHMLALHPIGRMGQAREIADPVVWLCSNAASFITGQSLTVDGGFTAQ